MAAVIRLRMESRQLTNIFRKSKSRYLQKVSPTNRNRQNENGCPGKQSAGTEHFFPPGAILALVYLQSKRQAPSRKAANSAGPWRTLTVPRWTTDLRPRRISTETEGRCPFSPKGGGSHNMEVERQTISLFYCRNCPTDGGEAPGNPRNGSYSGA